MKNLLCTKFSLPRQKALTSSCVCSHPLVPEGRANLYLKYILLRLKQIHLNSIITITKERLSKLLPGKSAKVAVPHSRFIKALISLQNQISVSKYIA